MAVNLGKVAQDFFGFDITPGFNISHAKTQNGAPALSATGTRNPLGTGSRTKSTQANQPANDVISVSDPSLAGGGSGGGVTRSSWTPDSRQH